MNFATIRHNSSYYGNCLSFLMAFILKKIHLHLEKNHFSYKKYVFWRHIIISKFQELHFPFLTLFNFKSFGGLNASFHMSYSLLEWVENWQIFIPSRLELLKTHHCVLWHTHLIVCAENVKSWFKLWVIHFTFQADALPHTLNCVCDSLFKFLIWILEQF